MQVMTGADKEKPPSVTHTTLPWNEKRGSAKRFAATHREVKEVLVIPWGDHVRRLLRHGRDGLHVVVACRRREKGDKCQERQWNRSIQGEGFFCVGQLA
jgi:hypothetical protein